MRSIYDSGVTLVIVEHIMEVIITLAERVVVFHQGRAYSHAMSVPLQSGGVNECTTD